MRGRLRQNSVPFTVNMKTPVKTRTMPLRKLLQGIFWECVCVLFEFIDASDGELVEVLKAQAVAGGGFIHETNPESRLATLNFVKYFPSQNSTKRHLSVRASHWPQAASCFIWTTKGTLAKIQIFVALKKERMIIKILKKIRLIKNKLTLQNRLVLREILQWKYHQHLSVAHQPSKENDGQGLFLVKKSMRVLFFFVSHSLMSNAPLLLEQQLSFHSLGEGGCGGGPIRTPKQECLSGFCIERC